MRLIPYACLLFACLLSGCGSDETLAGEAVLTHADVRIESGPAVTIGALVYLDSVDEPNDQPSVFMSDQIVLTKDQLIAGGYGLPTNGDLYEHFALVRTWEHCTRSYSHVDIIPTDEDPLVRIFSEIEELDEGTGCPAIVFGKVIILGIVEALPG